MPRIRFSFWVKTAFLFLLRSGRSTLILSLMIQTAVAVLIFLSALAVGVNDAMIRNSVSLYDGHISGFNLSYRLTRKDLLLAGVDNVLKRVSCPGILSSGGNRQMLTIVAVDPAAEIKSTALWRKTVAGRYPESGQRTVFLGQPVARKLLVKPGDEVFLSREHLSPAISLKVSGVFQTGIGQLDREVVFTPLNLFPGCSDTWSAAVFLKDGIDPEAVVKLYSDGWPNAGRFKTWLELMPDLRQLIDLNYISMTIVTVIVFGVVSFGISCAFVIFILKNLREYGIMKAMGVTSLEMALLLVCEVILMSLAACVCGCLLGIATVFWVRQTGIDLTAFTSHNRYFTVSGMIYPRLTAYAMGLPPALALFFSMMATLWPILLVVRKKTAAILRSS